MAAAAQNRLEQSNPLQISGFFLCISIFAGGCFYTSAGVHRLCLLYAFFNLLFCGMFSLSSSTFEALASTVA